MESLAATGMGHGTDQVLRSVEPDLAVEVISDLETPAPSHPNTLRIKAWDSSQAELLSWEVWSVGGGNLEDSSGPVAAGPAVNYPCSTLSAVLQICKSEQVDLAMPAMERL